MRKIVINESLTKRLILGFYIFCNAYALYVAIFNGVMVSDLHGIPAPRPLICVVLFALVAVSYLVVLGPLFNVVMRGRERASSQDWSGNIHSDLFIIALQVVYLWISIDLSLGVAGVYSTPSSPLKYFVYFVPVEYIVLVYVTMRANVAAALCVAGVYIVSGLLRGWSGGSIILGMVLAVRLCDARIAVKVWIITAAAAAAFVLSPIVFILRSLVRNKLGSLEKAFAYLSELSGHANLWYYSLFEFIERFQHLCPTMLVFEHRHELNERLYSGEMRLFVFEGNYGQATLSVLGMRPLEVGQIITKVYFNVDPTLVAYNIHTGLWSWVFIAPEFAISYVAYVGLLCVLNALLIDLAGFDRRGVLLSWMMWVLLLINGWFGAFISYLSALAFFGAFRILKPKISQVYFLLEQLRRRRMPFGHPL